MKLSTFNLEANKNQLIILVCIIGFALGLIGGIFFVHEYIQEYTAECRKQLTICIDQCARTNPAYAYNFTHLNFSDLSQ